VASGRSGWRLCRVWGARGVPRPPRRSRELPCGWPGLQGRWGCTRRNRRTSPRPPEGSRVVGLSRSLLTFRRCRPGPRGDPIRRPPRPKPEPATLMTLASTSKRPRRALVPPRGRSSSREIRRAPPPTCPRASTPGSKLPSARRCQASSAFRPRGFSPPRRFAPCAGSRVCCAPQPVRGSSRFGRGGAGPANPRESKLSREDGGGPPFDLLATRVHTLRRVSLVGSRHHIAVARCPLAVAGVVQFTAPAEADAGADPGEPGTAGHPSEPPPKGRPPERSLAPARVPST
jgi:hypothetical protein